MDEELGTDYSFPAGLSPLAAYEWLVTHRGVKRDEAQLAAVRQLDGLHAAILTCGEDAQAKDPSPTPPRGAFGGLLGLFGGTRSVSGRRPASSFRPPESLRGVYLHGGPGSGKTFVMDIFYRCAPTAHKRRAHFHSFMLDVHARLFAVRQGGFRGDPVPVVADDMAANSWLMCFDEMQVTDVGDAMIMRRLFTCLWERGLVVVATSNRPPRELYANGLQRELFLPFIDTLEARCDVHDMDSSKDYRLLATPLAAGTTWLCDTSLPPPPPPPHPHPPPPLPPSHKLGAGGGAAAHAALEAALHPASAALESAWRRVTGGEATTALTLTAQGRAIPVPVYAPRHKAARFSFADLCARPLGSADYQVMAQHLATIFIDAVPVLTLSTRNELRRFITLIDTLYDHRVKVVASAAAAPAALFIPVFVEVRPREADGGASLAAAHSALAAQGGPAAVRTKYDEVFAYDRTVSRLIEMQSADYLAAEWRPNISKSGTLAVDPADAAP